MGVWQKTRNTDFYISNKNPKLKIEISNIAASKEMSLSAFCKSLFIEARNKATEQERNYKEIRE